mgnify:FL=1
MRLSPLFTSFMLQTEEIFSDYFFLFHLRPIDG